MRPSRSVSVAMMSPDAGDLRRREPPRSQQLAETLQRGERSPQLVGGEGDANLT